MLKKAVAVLGAGNSRLHKVRTGLPAELEALGPSFDDNFEEVVTVDMDEASKPSIVFDLTAELWPLPASHFDEVHAYEVLEHLTPQGDYKAFFTLWANIWYILAPGGLVCATTPWWESLWVWQDPGHRMCYSPALLTYLSQREYEKQVGTTAMTDYRKFWPKPYSFMVRHAEMSGDDPKHAGFTFVLQKVEAK